MSYGSPDWRGQAWILPEKDGLEQIKLAYDAGINAFDTAAAIKEYKLPRDEIVVMTKVFGYSAWNKPKEDEEGARTVNQHGLSRKTALRACSLSIIDLLQCHRFDNETPIEETVCGHVRYIGMSSCWAWQFHAMQNYAIANKLTPFISMQNHHSLVYREEEREMFPTCKHFGVGIIPWSPLARGMLTRPITAQKDTSRGTAIPGSKNTTPWAALTDIVARVEEVAKKRGVSMAQGCTCVVDAQGRCACVLTLIKSFLNNPTQPAIVFARIQGSRRPIIGTTSTQKILDSAIHLDLTPEEMKYLEEPYLPSAVFGHN
ncbi:aryl-alcohol dehydrogenase [Mycena olivaceomarginata]|nr:aryl-alcohol dehydrogenase [Mycena olivaceomarginata]